MFKILKPPLWVCIYLHLTVTKAEGTCGGDYYTNTGAITSPNYPYHYNNGDMCVWTVNVNAGKIITIRFIDMNITSVGEGCQFDRVEVRDGYNEDSRLLGRYCGNKIPTPVTTSKNAMYVKFKSDANVSGTGFNASWTTCTSDADTDDWPLWLILVIVLAPWLLCCLSFLFCAILSHLDSKKEQQPHGGTRRNNFCNYQPKILSNQHDQFNHNDVVDDDDASNNDDVNASMYIYLESMIILPSPSRTSPSSQAWHSAQAPPSTQAPPSAQAPPYVQAPPSYSSVTRPPSYISMKISNNESTSTRCSRNTATQYGRPPPSYTPLWETESSGDMQLNDDAISLSRDSAYLPPPAYSRHYSGYTVDMTVVDHILY